jgi:GWxTD domain-containing protein
MERITGGAPGPARLTGQQVPPQTPIKFLTRRPRFRAARLCLMLLFCQLAGAVLPVAIATTCQGRLSSRAIHFGRPRFKAAVSSVFEADSTYGMLNFEVPYSELSFRKRDHFREANFDLIVHIFENDQLVKADMWPQHVRVAGRDEIRSRGAHFRKDLSFELPPGRYEMEVRLSEQRSGVEGTVCLRLDMPIRIPGRISNSSLLVGECGLTGSIPQLRRDPAISDRFFDATETICAYISVYHRGCDIDSARLAWELVSPGENIIDGGWISGPVGEAETRISWPISVKDLWLDMYQLNVTIDTGLQALHATTSFNMLTESNTALASFFRESFDVLRYIADEGEMQRLRMASPQERKRLWDEFWAERDPLPETEINEFKEQFFNRVRVANEMFSGVRPGWQTDQGRIYIINGDPDEVTRDNYSAWGHPMVIWYYNRLQLQFVFVDRRGFGEYELMERGW